jgi:phosphatidylinositol alpha-mannosyltransferase
VVAIEAQAAGVPVVATDLPALREAVTAGMHRLLFAPQDADGAATQLASLITDSVLRQRLTEEGRDFAARFSVTASADALMTGYHLHCEPRVIARRPPKMA